MSEQDKLHTEIQHGRIVEDFLATDAAREVFARLEADCLKQWKAADTVEKREAVHARMAALEALQNELRVSVTRGTVAKGRAQRNLSR